MKRSIICLLIIFTVIPCLLSAQKYGSGFDLLYSKLNEEQLYVSRITANPGPSWKRYRAAAFERATKIIKRTAHLKIELDLITK